MTLNVHLNFTPDSEILDYLSSLLEPNISLTHGSEVPDPANYEILVAGRPSNELLEASPFLRALIIPFAGLPEVTRDRLKQFPDLAVHNLHHNAASTAEMALALLLAVAKRLLPIDRTFRRHDWTPRYQANPSILLAGKTVLILGFGSIGRHVGRICQALDMVPIGIRRSPSPGEEIHSIPVFPEADLHTLLSKAEILFICLPDTPQTRGRIGKEELDLMPQDAILINVARGKIVDEGALYSALAEGGLLGAGLDVWYHYPEKPTDRANTPPSSHPFHELDNVIMSPHRAGGWRASEWARMDYLAEKLNLAAKGQPLRDRVDVRRGY
jgi:phosphoglycerate dehydrogenase-like enzyme